MTIQATDTGGGRPFDGDALTGRLFEQTIGAFELLNVYLGERLGLYRSLADGGSMTADEFAGHAAIAPRYAREWLEQQVTAGVLEVDDPGLEAEVRRYSMPIEHRATLLDQDSLLYAAFMPRFIASVGSTMPDLLGAYRTGVGVSWDTADRFKGMALDDPIERFLYAVSTTVCLPNGLAERPSAGTGTVIRPSTVERFAREAGFASTTILPIEHDVFRAYRLDA